MKELPSLHADEKHYIFSTGAKAASFISSRPSGTKFFIAIHMDLPDYEVPGYTHINAGSGMLSVSRADLKKFATGLLTHNKDDAKRAGIPITVFMSPVGNLSVWVG